jgi:Ca2+-transporting ATPase
MSTIIPIENKYRVMVKGAPDELIKLCTSYVDENCVLQAVTEEFIHEYNASLNHECDATFRTLSLAYKDTKICPQTAEEAEKDLTLLCTVSIRDSLRESTAECIKECQKAGIRVIMITGDHQKTAEAVGRECGILTEETHAVTGSDVRHMSNVELAEALKNICIIARSSPMDKHLVVSALKESGEIVAVTGDGTNDVPAMMAADVGLAMGKSGTELAKEASDIVVLDDDFKSIVKSVVWGRCIYNNIKRFLQFQLTANVVTLFVSFLSAVILHDTPFQAVQLLWVNLIMDSLGALALATGKPDDSLLKQLPEHKDAPLITNYMLKNIICQSILQIVLIGLILIFSGDMVSYSTKHYTYLFNVFVLCQMFNLVNARVVSHEMKITDGIMDNPLFFIIMFGIGIVQIILVQVAGLYFSCTPLTLHEWTTSTLLASLTIPVGFITRAFKIENALEYFTKTNNDFERL